MKTCPHCHTDIIMRKLRHQGFFKNYRVCPNCGGRFTVDKHTKYRQAVSLVIVLISLIFTLLMYYQSLDWLVPAIISYVVFGIIIYWGNKNLFLVPYKED